MFQLTEKRWERYLPRVLYYFLVRKLANSQVNDVTNAPFNNAKMIIHEEWRRSRWLAIDILIHSAWAEAGSSSRKNLIFRNRIFMEVVSKRSKLSSKLHFQFHVTEISKLHLFERGSRELLFLQNLICNQFHRLFIISRSLVSRVASSMKLA